MKPAFTFLLGSLILAVMQAAYAQDETLNLPKSIEAGSAFSIQNAGSGEATLYIVGPGQVLKRTVQLGTPTYFPAGSLCNAGHYVVILAQASGTNTGSFDVTPVKRPRQPELSCQAVAPSRRFARWHYRRGLRFRCLSQLDCHSNPRVL